MNQDREVNVRRRKSDEKAFTAPSWSLHGRAGVLADMYSMHSMDAACISGPANSALHSPNRKILMVVAPIVRADCQYASL